MEVNKDVSTPNTIKGLLVLLLLILSACAPSASSVQTAIAKTQAATIRTSTPTSIPTPTPTQWAWKVIKSIFTQEQYNDSDIWRVLPLANNLEVPDAFEMKLDMESVGANVIVLEGIKNRMEFACEEGTLGIFLRNDIVVGLAFDNNANRPAMPIINGATNCQITTRFDQYAKHIEIFQNNLLLFQLTPEEVGDFPGGLFPDGKIREVDLTSGPRSGNARSGSGHIISKVKLNELVFYAPTVVMSIPPEANTSEPAPTETVKIFQQCSAEEYKDCYISPGDLRAYADWTKEKLLQQGVNLPEPDPHRIIARETGGKDTAFMYTKLFGEKINKPERPFFSGYSFGYTEAEVNYDTGPGRATYAVSTVAFSVPKKPGELVVIPVLILHFNDVLEPEFIHDYLNKWLNNGHLFMAVVDRNHYQMEPFTSMNEAAFKDLEARAIAFENTLDPTNIDGVIFEAIP